MSLRRARRLGCFLFSIVLVAFVVNAESRAAEVEIKLSSPSPLLLQHPTINQQYVVFAFAGDLWRVPRTGGKALNLTHGEGVASAPVFSPDGTKLAFTWQVGGNDDVYVFDDSKDASRPRRLTYHPSPDTVVGWTPDSKHVLFRSPRGYAFQFQSLFTIPVEGGAETPLPLPMGNEASYDADGSHLAYVPTEPKISYVKRYKGGRTTPIWIARLSDSTTIQIPHGNFTDFNPVWVGDRIYFLSDRSGAVTLFAYDVKSRRVTKCFENRGFDLKSAQYGFGEIVYEQLGSIHLFDPVTNKDASLNVEIEGIFPRTTPRELPLEPEIKKARISSVGRVAFEARGDILVFDPATALTKNVTSSPAVMDRDPQWSPDGSSLAYFSDESGEYALHIRNVSNQGGVQKIQFMPGFFESPRWSADGNKIAYRDNNQKLWIIDRNDPKPILVGGQSGQDYAWAPDSGSLAFSQTLKNRLWGLFVFRLPTAERVQLTDGMEDATSPVFVNNSKHLYFLASAMGGWKRGGGLSAEAVPMRRSLYECDFEGKISIKALPLPVRDYEQLFVGGQNSILMAEHTAGGLFEPGIFSLYSYDLTTKETVLLGEGVSDVETSAQNILFSRDKHWFVTKKGDPLSTASQLHIENATVYVDPKAEWNQMYGEFWRLVRDFLYDPTLHGLNWSELRERYQPFMPGIMSRGDLNNFAKELLGTMTTSHLKFAGGDPPLQKAVPVGLLGADFILDSNRYRFSKIYKPGPWDPDLRTPLTDTGIQSGDYLIAIDGHQVKQSDNLFSFLENAVGNKVKITVSKEVTGQDSRTVEVEPISSEFRLRQEDWIENNRRRVNEATNGRVAYVYVPDTLETGFRRFNRDFYAQIDKDAIIVDIRFIPGGATPEYFVDRLAQQVLSLEISRGDPGPRVYPPTIQGPKVLLINEYAGSGGDAFADFFRRMHIGKIIGKRTWGGLVGAFNTPAMMDGSEPEVPNSAIFQPSGRLEVENYGVAPDEEVELDPALMRKGVDPQLESAISSVMGAIKNESPRKPIPLVYQYFQ